MKNQVIMIFFELNNEILDHLYNLDCDLFTEFCLIYVDWVKAKSFNFDYCDVIIGLIHNIYNKSTDNDLKSKCVISAAELGKSHNRWYVMEYVVKMANSDIEENLAFRIQIEIDIDSRAKSNFQRCVEGLHRTKNSYHKLIAKVI